MEGVAELPTMDQVTPIEKSVNWKETCALIEVDNQWRAAQDWLEVKGGCLHEIDYTKTFQQYVSDLEQWRTQKDKAKQDERKKGTGFFVKETETLVVLLIHVSIGVAVLLLRRKKRESKRKGKNKIRRRKSEEETNG